MFSTFIWGSVLLYVLSAQFVSQFIFLELLCAIEGCTSYWEYESVSIDPGSLLEVALTYYTSQSVIERIRRLLSAHVCYWAYESVIAHPYPFLGATVRYGGLECIFGFTRCYLRHSMFLGVQVTFIPLFGEPCPFLCVLLPSLVSTCLKLDNVLYALCGISCVLLTFVHLHVVMAPWDSSYACTQAFEWPLKCTCNEVQHSLTGAFCVLGTFVQCVDKSARVPEVLSDFSVSRVQLWDLTWSACAWRSICFLSVTSLFLFCHVNNMGLLRLYGCTCP